MDYKKFNLKKNRKQKELIRLTIIYKIHSQIKKRILLFNWQKLIRAIKTIQKTFPRDWWKLSLTWFLKRIHKLLKCFLDTLKALRRAWTGTKISPIKSENPQRFQSNKSERCWQMNNSPKQHAHCAVIFSEKDLSLIF